MRAGEFNIIIGSPSERDIDVCFFSPPVKSQTDICDDFIWGDENWQWPQLLKEIKAFPSTGQARKNGWNKPIDDGFSEIKIGRRKICVLKCTETFLKELEQ